MGSTSGPELGLCWTRWTHWGSFYSLLKIRERKGPSRESGGEENWKREPVLRNVTQAVVPYIHKKKEPNAIRGSIEQLVSSTDWISFDYTLLLPHFLSTCHKQSCRSQMKYNTTVQPQVALNNIRCVSHSALHGTKSAKRKGSFINQILIKL